jgi:hypothetical protein
MTDAQRITVMSMVKEGKLSIDQAIKKVARLRSFHSLAEGTRYHAVSICRSWL